MGRSAAIEREIRSQAWDLAHMTADELADVEADAYHDMVMDLRFRLGEEQGVALSAISDSDLFWGEAQDLLGTVKALANTIRASEVA